MAEKRVIEYEAASELANDDWLLIDGVTEGTRKARPSTVTAELGAQVTNLASTVGGLTQVAMGHEQSFAPSYDEDTSYDVGDLVMQYHGLYKCTAPTTGPWDAGKWERAEVSEQLEESGKIDDVQVNGVSVVTDKVASIDLTGMQDDIDSKQADTKIGGASILDNNKVANLDFLASYGEASGSIASFNDGAAMPLKSLKVGIEAVQDLHGYDSPWVGGSGKNKFNKSTVNVDKYIGADGQLATSQYNQDVTDFIPVTSGQSYIINSSINTNNYSCFYDENKNVVGSVFANTQFPKVAPSDAKYIRVTFANADINTFMVEQGTTASSTYYPYSNICPISGWSAVNVYISPTTLSSDGTTYTTTLKDGQGNPLTCYGGTLSNENGVQTLENILGQQNMANWNWVRESAGGGNYRFRSKSAVWSEYQRQSTIGLSSAFTINRSPIGGAKIDNTLWVHSDGLVYIYCDTYTDVDSFKEFIKDVQLFLPRITPQTIPQDNLAIATQEGTNNIWADSGDILECKYVRDNSAVINDLIARVTALENA